MSALPILNSPLLAPAKGRARNPKAGFSLVELMVSISVLAVLGGLVAQLMGSATRLTSTSKQSSDCDNEARAAFAQIAADLSRRVRRPDVDAFVSKNTGDDLLFFFSETSGYSPNLLPANRSTTALVGYRLKEVTVGGVPSMELQRYARSLPWISNSTDAAMPFVVLTGSGSTPIPASTLAGVDGKGTGGSFPKTLLQQDASEEVYYQPIATNVLRFEVSLLKKPDLTDPAKPIEARLLKDAEIPAELSKFGFSNISSVIISLALIDSQNAAKITPTAAKTALPLSDTTQGSAVLYPLDAWNNDLQTAVPTLTGRSRPLLGGVRFYQRVISL